MTIRDELREALSGLSTDNTPTPERQEKSQFSMHNNVWKVRTIAERLYGCERITQDEYDACQRWAITFVQSYDGVGAQQDGASTALIKHDPISYALHMAMEKDCIPEIKSRIGDAYHNLLVLSLYHCYSAGQIGSILAKQSSRGVELAVDKMCCKAYVELYKAYLALKKVNKKKHARTVRGDV